MSKRVRSVSIGQSKAPMPAPDRFTIEVKSMRGVWVPYTTCRDDSPEHVAATVRAQGGGWMLDRREIRTVPI